jgi:DNA polymerase elongation subunit (family B)
LHFYTSVEVLGDDVLFRGYKDGLAYKEKISYKPSIFIPSNTKTQSDYRTLDGAVVERLEFNSISEARDFINNYKGVVNFSIYGQTNWSYAFLAERFPTEIKYDFETLKLAYIDIEVDSEGGFATIEGAEKEIIAITIFLKGKYVVFGLKDYVPKDSAVRYIKCPNETQLITQFLNVWERMGIDIVTGWNIEGFDIPYLINRIKNVSGMEQAKKLSPWGRLKRKKITGRFGYEIDTYDIAGITILDYLPLFRKFSDRRPENYKLNTVAHEIVGEKKVDFSEFKSLSELYRLDHDKFIDYNIRDVTLLVKIEAEENMLQLAANIAYSAKINLIDVFKQTRIWDAIIYNYLLERKIVIPQRQPTGSDGEMIDGGYVKDPYTGIYDWVVSLDLRSLYPSLIMHYNISPETYKGKVDVILENLVKGVSHGYEKNLTKDNLSLAANGTLYSREVRGFIPEIVEYYFDRRKFYKDLQLEKERERLDINENHANYVKLSTEININKIYQMNYKIALNALYGSIGNPGFRFYNPDWAEGITVSGQLTTRWAARKLNEYFNTLLKTTGIDYVLAADTDSVFVHMDPLVKKMNLSDRSKIVDFLDAFCIKKLQPKLDAWFDELKEFMNAYEQKLYMKREKICEKVLWTAKKRYICSVWDNEGIRYPEAKVSVTGIEAVRSTTPEFCKQALKDSFKIIMNQPEADLHVFIEKVRKSFYDLPLEEMAIPKGVKGLFKYGDKHSIYGKGTPMHVRAALLYNKRLKDLGLDTKVESITEGEKIKYIFLKVPNPIQENVIGFNSYLPKEMKLHDYIDINTQFSKTFVEPLQGVLDAINWSVTPRSTLEDLFA